LQLSLPPLHGQAGVDGLLLGMRAHDLLLMPVRILPADRPPDLLAALSAVGGALNLPGSHTLSTWLGHTFGEVKQQDRLTSWSLEYHRTALAAIALAAYLYGPKFRATQATGRAPSGRSHSALLRCSFTGMQHKWWVDSSTID